MTDSIDNPQLRRALTQTLQSWQRAGVSAVPRDAGPVATVQAAGDATATPTAADADPAPDPSETPREPNTLTEPSTPRNPENQLETLQSVAACVAGCRRCTELAETRTQTVFGVGDPNARVMFIGEAPGADEDRTGEPFVGRAGQLLNKIVEACGWSRDEIYICNILKCRPPGNRNPDPAEAANCREYLDAQIETVAPEYIVCWGSIAAKNLLDSKESIGRMRNKFFTYGQSRVLCTYHPSYLLRNPAAKKDVWADMKLLMREMGLDPDRAAK